MTKEQAIAELKGCLKDYLETRGIDTRQNFRCLNPDHEDKHPSMGFNANKNQVHCFSCEASYDIIDLIRLEFNCDFNEALKRGCEIYHIDYHSDRAPSQPPQSQAELERERQERATKNAEIKARERATREKRRLELKAEFEAAQPATEHAYLKEKQVRNDGTLRIDKDGALLIPLYGANGRFKTYQRIFAETPPDGQRKRLAKGEGLKTGSFHVIGGSKLQHGENVILAEGYATAATIQELIGDRYRVVMGIDAGNLLSATDEINTKFLPTIFVAADDDRGKHEDTGENPGVKAAEKCCYRGALGYFIPPFSAFDRAAGLSDWNDYFCKYGADATREALLKAIKENLITPYTRDFAQEAIDRAKEAAQHEQPVLDVDFIDTQADSIEVNIDEQSTEQNPDFSDEESARLASEAEQYSQPDDNNFYGDFNNPTPEAVITKADRQDTGQILNNPQQGGIIRVKLINANELLKKEFPPVKWAVEGILPMGLSLLAGSPKIGKSFLSLQLSLAVALGGVALGKIQVKRGSVLNLALEDPERRLKERILNSGLDAKSADLSRLDLVTELAKQNDGGMAFIKSWLDNHSDARLVVIDTLQKFRQPKQSKGDIYGADYTCMEELKQLADDYSVPFLIIHHFRKAKKSEDSGDWVDNFLGTTGLAGAADTLLSLTRQRGQDAGILKITGRDIEEAELALKRDEFGWILEGEAAEFKLSDNEKRIVNFLKENGGKTPKEIAEALGLESDEEKTGLRVKLGRMVSKNKISKTGMSYFA
ncbi:MAG: AAA family ATPase [Synergistaceae bacterium]|nr:AAA family ATPase [Synergistaceae bacterium]